MAINVPPVTGKTPTQVATELRVLIRDQLWYRVKEALALAGPGPVAPSLSSIHLNDTLETQRAILIQIEDLLTLISKEATLRKPTLTRDQVNVVRHHILRLKSRMTDTKVYADRLHAEKQSTNLGLALQEINDLCVRAYSLVQALPTIDNSAVGREANTIRAITAILKVHWGVEVEGTIEGLPEIMPALLEAIKKPPGAIPVIPDPPAMEPDVIEDEIEFEGEPETFDPKFGFKLTKKPALPWQVLSQQDEPCGLFTIQQTSGIQGLTEHGFKPPGVPSTSSSDGWNGGHCTPLVALKTLIAHRLRYNDSRFTLVDNSGFTFARAEKNKPLELRNGFGDVLYHLRKEYKDAKSKVAPKVIADNPYWIANTNVIVTSNNVTG